LSGNSEVDHAVNSNLYVTTLHIRRTAHGTLA
jgi:hypothetical protein